MKLRSIAREAWRNIVSGASRAALFSVLLAALLAGLALADILAVTSITRAADAYRASGASVIILSAKDRVDGAACAALADVPGVRSVGALRETTRELRAAALPSSPVPLYEATAGVSSILSGRSPGALGITLSDQAAAPLGVAGGGMVTTIDGAVPVTDVYEYPDDGRRAGLGYAALALVTDAGVFDECWVDAWPAPGELPSLLQLTLLPSSGDALPPKLGQLNSSKGTSFDGAQRLGERITRFAPLGALLVGTALGLISVRVRRVALASALHAGVRRGDLALMLALETASWAFIAAALCTGASSVATLHRGADLPALLELGVRVAALGALGTLAGAWLGFAATREKHLYRTFKER